jgi:acyl carrier protein
VLSQRLKAVLIKRLSLQLEEDEISEDSPLFGAGLGLDSVDALEIAIAVEMEFGVPITDDDLQAFRSVNTILDLIQERAGGAKGVQ